MTTTAITPLRQRMIEDMNGRKLCAGTQKGHIRSCKRFAAFLKRLWLAAAKGDFPAASIIHCWQCGVHRS